MHCRKNCTIHVTGYHKLYCFDISDREGGLLVSFAIKTLIHFDTPSDIQVTPFELNLRKEKWMFISIYRPPSQNKKYFLDKL